ncbi:MAG TPA: CPBP family intramembrane glutamic endopeptidase [Gemmatimonadales bacterium]|nr:CPBP family intramembrane glutamic endopeptidase [Gemmatimonadales bacterium]
MNGSEPGQRWAWAFGIATVLSAAVWYLARADTIALQRSTAAWFTITGRALPANTAFTLTFISFGVGPALLAQSVLGRSALSLGLRLGDARELLKLLAIGAPIALMAAYVSSRSPAIVAVYPLGGQLAPDPGAFALHAGGYLLYYLGFEYLFRGFLLLGTKDHIGPVAANLLQACLVTAFHFGKPGLEMAAVLPASLLFGWATLRTGSIWCALALHWVVGVSLDWFLVFAR